jgi:hypothetical protein
VAKSLPAWQVFGGHELAESPDAVVRPAGPFAEDLINSYIFG